MPTYTFNICGADEHVPDVERYIRTMKDRVRSQYNDMPYEHIPRAMLVRLAEYAVFWLNAVPHDDSVTPDYSPRYFIEGRQLDYLKHMKMEFGAYAHTHNKHDNTMQARTMIAGICLGTC